MYIKNVQGVETASGWNSVCGVIVLCYQVMIRCTGDGIKANLKEKALLTKKKKKKNH